MAEILREYDLEGKRSKKPQYYITQFEVAYHTSNGKQKWVDKFELYLIVEPASSSDDMDKFTCKKFFTQTKGQTKVSIPSLAGWSYNFPKIS